MNERLVAIREIFLDAMIEGWAHPDIQKTTLADIPGSKAIWFEKEKFRVLDWYVKSGDRSAGNTMIWEREELVWIMSYGGFYPKNVIQFLKVALRIAYSERWFLGGRGPAIVKTDEFVYINSVIQKDFTRFSGEEKIYRRSNHELVGFHNYWGMSLIS